MKNLLFFVYKMKQPSYRLLLPRKILWCNNSVVIQIQSIIVCLLAAQPSLYHSFFCYSNLVSSYDVAGLPISKYLSTLPYSGIESFHLIF